MLIKEIPVAAILGGQKVCVCDYGMQVMKVVFPVYYGAKYQCEKVPKHAVIKALRAQRAAQIEVPASLGDRANPAS